MVEELHGCCYTEICSGCGKRFRHAEEVCRGSPDHKTGNSCDFCGHELLDTIVNFSDTYRDEIEPVIVSYHAKRADLALVLGTSMCVQPAASYPSLVFRGVSSEPTPAVPAPAPAPSAAAPAVPAEHQKSMVIVNLQQTPSDNLATVRIYARIDRFMKSLMQALEIADFDQTFDAKITWADEDKSRKAAMKKAASGGKSTWWPF